MPQLIALLFVVGVVIMIVRAIWKITLILGGLALAAWILYRTGRYVLKERYFASEKFLAHKRKIASVVAEHNEIAEYVAEIRNRGSFSLGVSSTGTQAYLAEFENTSYHNYRRDRNVANYEAPNVHNCSLQVVRNASADPVKYVMKYFDIRADEAHLANVENVGEDITRLENAVDNLGEREASITESFAPPAFIMKHYAREFMEHVGVELSPISVPYPTYIFEYVSAGGNSSQRTTVKFNTPTVDALIETLSEKIRFRKSAAGQRALMTSRLRNAIKTRDNHTCRQCAVSLAAEPHLLLEVDHIIPLSKGGLSTLENLQTLCWRCNRSKSNKIEDRAVAPTSPATRAANTVPANVSKVRCHRCQYVQLVPKSQLTFVCDGCGQNLKRAKTA
jgi:hypothetical protein